MQSILLEFELQPNWRASIVACKLPVLSALRRFSVLVGGRLAFRRIIRRKATTRASLHFSEFSSGRAVAPLRGRALPASGLYAERTDYRLSTID